MKINPLEKQLPLAKSNGTLSGKIAQTEAFGKVLEQTLQSAQDSGVSSTGQTAGPMLQGIQPFMDVRQDLYNRVDRLLNTFDNYQLLLGDSRTNLKDLAGALEDLKGEARDMAAMMENVGHTDPLKSIVNETLVAVSKEVFNFESGSYVD